MAEFVTHDEYEGRKLLADERQHRVDARILTLEQNSEKLTTLSIQMGEMLKNHDSKIEDHENRLDIIEHRPASLMDKVLATITTSIISAIVSGVVAWLTLVSSTTP